MIGVMQNGTLFAMDEIMIPIFPEVAINTVAIPQLQKEEVKRNVLSADEKEAFRNVRSHMTVSEAEQTARHARGLRSDGISVDFDPGSSEPDSERAKGFIPINDGKGGSDRAQDVDRVDSIDPAIKRQGLAPARLDGRDGESDPLADAQMHLLSVDHDEPEAIEAGICKGEGCDENHVARAHELLGRNLSMREALPSSHGMVRFAR